MVGKSALTMSAAVSFSSADLTVAPVPRRFLSRVMVDVMLGYSLRLTEPDFLCEKYEKNGLGSWLGRGACVSRASLSPSGDMVVPLPPHTA